MDRRTSALGAWLRRNIARNDSAADVPPYCTAQQEERECASGDTARSRYRKKVAEKCRRCSKQKVGENCPWRTRDVSADGVCLAGVYT